MIRFDRNEQWAATEFAQATNPLLEPWEAPRRTHTGRRPYIPLGCDQQSRLVPTLQQRINEQPEPAHAAITWDDDTDTRAIPGAGPAVWLAAGVVLLVTVPAAVHLLAVFGVL